MISTPQPVLATTVALALVGSLLVGCGKRRVVKEDEEPLEPVPTTFAFRAAPQPALAMAPPVTKPVNPTLEDARRWRDAQPLREQAIAAAAAQHEREKERARQAQREEEARQAAQRAREKAENARRAAQKEETRALVALRVRRDLKSYADSLKLTIVEELPVEVTFNEDLRSGTVSYRIWLNDTGLMGVKSATMVWKGEMKWALVERGDAVAPSTPKPTVIPLDANGMPVGTPANKPEKKKPKERSPEAGAEPNPSSRPPTDPS